MMCIFSSFIHSNGHLYTRPPEEVRAVDLELSLSLPGQQQSSSASKTKKSFFKDHEGDSSPYHQPEKPFSIENHFHEAQNVNLLSRHSSKRKWDIANFQNIDALYSKLTKTELPEGKNWLRLWPMPQEPSTGLEYFNLFDTHYPGTKTELPDGKNWLRLWPMPREPSTGLEHFNFFDTHYPGSLPRAGAVKPTYGSGEVSQSLKLKSTPAKPVERLDEPKFLDTRNTETQGTSVSSSTEPVESTASSGKSSQSQEKVVEDPDTQDSHFEGTALESEPMEISPEDLSEEEAADTGEDSTNQKKKLTSTQLINKHRINSDKLGTQEIQRIGKGVDIGIFLDYISLVLELQWSKSAAELRDMRGLVSAGLKFPLVYIRFLDSYQRVVRRKPKLPARPRWFKNSQELLTAQEDAYISLKHFWVRVLDKNTSSNLRKQSDEFFNAHRLDFSVLESRASNYFVFTYDVLRRQQCAVGWIATEFWLTASNKYDKDLLSARNNFARAPKTFVNNQMQQEIEHSEKPPTRL
ncbi:hypothetical protein O181_027503 [Austropuccinia psidii MF-1]|uniref:Uncharacterized protein n=1 Tax=Austropuccinia psidii MF-1 TaxID=1389203 RepID=A0A9Q3CPP6_9BASI|nr:hypothetical protein [Austropuccinia psidii MF-1]